MQVLGPGCACRIGHLDRRCLGWQSFAEENPVEVLNFDQRPRRKPGRRNNQTSNANSLSATVRSLAAVTKVEHGNNAARIQRQSTTPTSTQPQRRQEVSVRVKLKSEKQNCTASAGGWKQAAEGRCFVQEVFPPSRHLANQRARSQSKSRGDRWGSNQC
jgi:hypothetical protein